MQTPNDNLHPAGSAKLAVSTFGAGRLSCKLNGPEERGVRVTSEELAAHPLLFQLFFETFKRVLLPIRKPLDGRTQHKKVSYNRFEIGNLLLQRLYLLQLSVQVVFVTPDVVLDINQIFVGHSCWLSFVEHTGCHDWDVFCNAVFVSLF